MPLSPAFSPATLPHPSFLSGPASKARGAYLRWSLNRSPFTRVWLGPRGVQPQISTLTRGNTSPTEALGFPCFQDAHLHNPGNRRWRAGAARPPSIKARSVQVTKASRTHRLRELLARISPDCCSGSSRQDIPSPGCRRRPWTSCSPARQPGRAGHTPSGAWADPAEPVLSSQFSHRAAVSAVCFGEPGGLLLLCPIINLLKAPEVTREATGHTVLGHQYGSALEGPHSKQQEANQPGKAPCSHRSAANGHFSDAQTEVT